MSKKISFANHKGGVCKTTSVLVTGQLFARSKLRVLFVDMDAQGNLSHSLRADTKKNTVWDVLTKEKTVSETIQRTQ